MKLLIVDDEIQIRAGLQEGIVWDELGIEEVYTAQNGIEALEICNQYKPEIVITDIRIPGMSGLELGKVIKNRYEPVEVIVLSGYSEFEYAREAISIRVFQYLLKPIRVNVLIECVKGAKEKIEEYRTANHDRDEFRCLNRTRILQQMMMSNLMLSTDDERIFRKQLKGNISNDVVVGVFSVDILLEKELDQFGRLLEIQLHEILEKNKAQELFWERGNLFFVMEVFSKNDRKRKLEFLKKDMELYNQMLKEHYQNTISIAVSDVGTLKMAAILFRETESILKKRMYVGSACFLEKEEQDYNSQITLSPIDTRELQQRIESLDYSHVHIYIQKVFREMEENRVTSIAFAKSVCVQMKDVLLQTMKNKGIDLEGIFEHNQMLFKEIPEYFTLTEYRIWTENIYQIILQGLSTLSGTSHSRVILQAVDYISKNYAKSINLEMTAEYVNKSKNYFSYLFKKELGISFVEYLNQVRIEAAKKLLETTDEKTYEISEKVGYSDYKYFSSVFKKLTGISPAQYKKCLNRKISDNFVKSSSVWEKESLV